jgi:hypothetical protein
VIAEARRINPRIKLILTSAYELEKALDPLNVPEFASFIRKPFHLSDLLNLLQDPLSAKSGAV